MFKKTTLRHPDDGREEHRKSKAVEPRPEPLTVNPLLNIEACSCGTGEVLFGLACWGSDSLVKFELFFRMRQQSASLFMQSECPPGQ